MSAATRQPSRCARSQLPVRSYADPNQGADGAEPRSVHSGLSSTMDRGIDGGKFDDRYWDRLSAPQRRRHWLPRPREVKRSVSFRRAGRVTGQKRLFG